MGLVFLIQFLSDARHLSAFEVGDLDRAPALGGAYHGAEHKLEDRLLAEGVGDDLEAPALLDEQALQEVGGQDADRPAVRDGHAQVRDAGLEVGGQALGELAGDGARCAW